MSVSPEQVITDALGLPEADRLELVEALIASLESPEAPPFDESWREVIRRRSEEVSSGRVTSIPWSEVKVRAREALGG